MGRRVDVQETNFRRVGTKIRKDLLPFYISQLLERRHFHRRLRRFSCSGGPAGSEQKQ